MDDDYELVPKDLISQLKTENQELKKKIETLQNSKQKTPTIDPNLANKITQTIQEEGKKESELIIENLRSIKEVTQTTLNNVLDRTQNLDTKISEMSKNTSLLVSSISELIEVISQEEKPQKENQDNKELQELKTKIENIENFMKKLETMLSQVKKIQ